MRFFARLTVTVTRPEQGAPTGSPSLPVILIALRRERALIVSGPGSTRAGMAGFWIATGGGGGGGARDCATGAGGSERGGVILIRRTVSGAAVLMVVAPERSVLCGAADVFGSKISTFAGAACR